MGMGLLNMGQEGGNRAREEKNAAPPPNFDLLARQQAEEGWQNTDRQTRGNRPNQSNAFGFGSNWTQAPDGSWTQQQTLGGPLGNAMQGIMGQAATNAQNGMLDPSGARDQAITGAYNQATSRLNPQWDQRDRQLAATLANQGLDPNSQAYRTAMQQQGLERNDAYSSAMNGAIGQGTLAGSALFNQGVQAQMMPYQQLGQLFGLGGQQEFAGAGLAPSSDLLGAAMAQMGFDQNQLNAAREARAQQYQENQNMQDSATSVATTVVGMNGKKKQPKIEDPEDYWKIP